MECRLGKVAPILKREGRKLQKKKGRGGGTSVLSGTKQGRKKEVTGKKERELPFGGSSKKKKILERKMEEVESERRNDGENRKKQRERRRVSVFERREQRK